MSEEIKPCPFCGGIPKIIDDRVAFRQCGPDNPMAMEHDTFCFNDHHKLYKSEYVKWNNAYCWKQLQKEKAKTARMREKLKKIQAMAGHPDANKACRFIMDEAKEVLEETKGSPASKGDK